jgi:hypothetical protein
MRREECWWGRENLSVWLRQQRAPPWGRRCSSLDGALRLRCAEFTPELAEGLGTSSAKSRSYMVNEAQENNNYPNVPVKGSNC